MRGTTISIRREGGASHYCAFGEVWASSYLEYSRRLALVAEANKTGLWPCALGAIPEYLVADQCRNVFLKFLRIGWCVRNVI